MAPPLGRTTPRPLPPYLQLLEQVFYSRKRLPRSLATLTGRSFFSRCPFEPIFFARQHNGLPGWSLASIVRSTR